MKLKIGDFARISQVTVQTLRYYDDLGLLHPADVDNLTGYRYYDIDQLPHLHRILALKDLGFSLEQITRLMQGDLSPAELRGMLTLKQSELRNQVQEQLDRMERLEARLRLIEQENHPLTYEVLLKPVAAFSVASVRRIIPSYWDEGPLWVDLFNQLEKAGVEPVNPCLSVYHACEPEIDAEVCAPVALQPGERDDLHIHTLPAVETMAFTIHCGPFTGLAGAYAALLKWVDANDYHIAGPDREIYLQLPKAGQQHSDQNAVTEMQVPVRKKNG
ncbi:MAG: MerR family transcriptional regulator [Anaerolineales bacterium]|nr:MerR family transcriptional regulator [Anaerolineales bacterium]